MAIRKEMLQELLKDYKDPEDPRGEDAVLKELTRDRQASAGDRRTSQGMWYVRR
jgi:hypothetical protein